MKFKSAYFAKTSDLIAEKDRLWDYDRDRRKREIMVRGFYNMKDLETQQEGERDDSAGLTNHGIGYRNLSRLAEGVFAIYSTTNSLIEIKVETGDAEADLLTGEKLAKNLNEAIYFSGEFEATWSSVSGELCLGGRAPLVFARYGWCPTLASNLLLPENTSGVPKKIPYAFAAHELSMSVLAELKAAAAKGDKYIDGKVVDSLIDIIKKQTRGEGDAQNAGNQGRENLLNPLKEGIMEDTRTTIKAWKYFEVKYNETKNRTEVSCTLLTERINLEKKSPAPDGEALVVSFAPVAYEDPSHWLHTMIVDSQIGGLKTFAAARGPAELTFNSDTDSEELLNELMAGEKLRARPKFRMTADANKQQVDEWNVSQDSVVPKGVESVQMYGAGANLGQVLALLNQNSSSLTGGSFSSVGRDGNEKLPEAKARIAQGQSMENNRMSAVYTAGDRLAREITRRFINGPLKPGTEGYDEIAWFREELADQGIDDKMLKMLGKMKHGRFCYLKVRMARSVGSGDRDSEMAVATLFMENIGKFDPQVRPMILRKWVNLVSRDPNLAEALVTLPPVIINSQKLDAETEFPTMLRRAGIGQTLPVSVEDIGEDHVPVHLLDLQAFLSESAFRQFNELDLRGYAGVIDHINAHLQAMMSVPASAGAAKVFAQQLNRLTQAAKPILQKVQDQQEQAQSMGMTPAEQAKISLDAAKLHLSAQQEGRKQAEFQEIVKSRKSRERQGDRKQYASETQQVKQNDLAEQKLEVDKQKAKNASKPKAKTSS